MSATDLAAYVGAGEQQSDFVSRCWGEAGELVGAYVEGYQVPEEILDRATLEVGSELFHRKSAPNGVMQGLDFNGAPIRIARDPMLGAIPLLSRWVAPV